MTIDEIVSAIRSLSIPERLRLIELVAHDVANDAFSERSELAEEPAVSLMDRNGFLVAHGASGATLPEEAFDHRVGRDARAESVWSRS